jgi:hypothetical protein
MMKGKIDNSGALWIDRGSEIKKQFCPFWQRDKIGLSHQCNDYCPLFGEPSLIGSLYTISLCHKTLHFEELTDERE